MSYKVGDLYTLNRKFYTDMNDANVKLYFQNHVYDSGDWQEYFSTTSGTTSGIELTSGQGEFPTTPGTTLLWDTEPTAREVSYFLQSVPFRRCYLVGLAYAACTLDPDDGFTKMRVGVVKSDHADNISEDSTVGDFYSLGHIDSSPAETTDVEGKMYHGHTLFDQPASGSNAIVSGNEGVGFVLSTHGTGDSGYVFGTMTATFMVI